MQFYILLSLICCIFFRHSFALQFNKTQCGIRPNIDGSSSPLDHLDIIGGHISASKSWPWSVSILQKDILMRLCGATIIDQQWIVTAGHCLENLDDNKWYAEIGKYKDFQSESYTLYSDVVKVVRHPKFADHDGLYNDIALLKLNNTIPLGEFNNSLNSICLSNYKLLEKSNKQLDSCYITGWGTTTVDGPASPYLRELQIPLVNSERCFATHKFEFDPNTQICAGGLKNGGQGTCFGDSGSALQCLVDDLWYLVGITSYGRPCAKPNIADVFTKVAAYTDWIQNTISNN